MSKRTKFCQKFRIQEECRETTQGKVRFASAFQVSKKFQNNSRSSRDSRTIDHHVVVQNQILATKTQKKWKIEELGDINTSHHITSHQNEKIWRGFSHPLGMSMLGFCHKGLICSPLDYHS